MGRGKIEIKRIENSTNRQVTYSKRRNGLLKKAKEITVLCDADVSLVIFSATGKMSEYCSSSTTLIKMLDRYQKASGNRLWDAKHEYLSMEVDRIKKENDSMQIELRHLKGEDLTSLHPKELIHIEEALENGLTGVRDKQEELLSILKKNERILEEENMRLTYMLHHHHLAIDGNVRDVEQGYQQKESECSSQMQFAFRVQPIQPNLQNK
ncbi:GLOBOSA-like protein gene [Cinnamomum micranthum f. kanehirae]|uniref:GLOBOSA-like protein protein n=1 Tax=Cinnamomum micranthum f. kanehirae TaxID=337451 RepID=A0A3S3QYS6_9MAGN|nr:GLOBOSA-like protein gene [Cinnamomum micranthum f. kanehirae]